MKGAIDVPLWHVSSATSAVIGDRNVDLNDATGGKTTMMSRRLLLSAMAGASLGLHAPGAAANGSAGATCWDDLEPRSPQ